MSHHGKTPTSIKLAAYAERINEEYNEESYDEQNSTINHKPGSIVQCDVLRREN